VNEESLPRGWICGLEMTGRKIMYVRMNGVGQKKTGEFDSYSERVKSGS